MNKNTKIAKELVKIAKDLMDFNFTLDGDYRNTGDYSFGEDPKSIHDQYEQDRLDEAEKQGKKYILHHKEGNFWRIQACKDFVVQNGYAIIAKGDFGGLIEKEENLSQEGECWVGDDARVFGDAQVWGDAIITDGAQVWRRAKVFGKAKVIGNAQVYGDAQVFGKALVGNKAMVYGSAKVNYTVKGENIAE